ncbi:cysteine synthase family protein [Streptomyces sp. MB09-02B]|uniref:PLP-dependent cysteine synthase family protein n=1 Tax=Streptomyces sp. MB09-02B TaxID=3028667 RepID=UPI0029AE15DA|nr:cysteine synthase family protein [Streptomyces sp. MB09-02B]MDX3643932.1 cysteine synthase family protein [Streptomyces sp. MB09-02B]
MRPGTLAAIGNTPLVELRHLAPSTGARVLVKLEYLNPTGAMKDRLALAMVEGAERDGTLVPGMTIVEYTGGSTGPGLALVCAVKGYRLKIVTSACFSDEPRRLMRALGADVEVLDAAVAPGTVTPTDIDAMRARAADLARQPGHYFTDQFNNPYVVAGLRDGLGREILDQSAHLPVAAFCTGIGSAASLLGVAAAIRRRDPRPRIVGLEPAGSPGITAGTRGVFAMQGWSGFAPPLFDMDAVDAVDIISDDDACATTSRLAEEEGIFTGVSGGANVYGALRLAARLPPETAVVTLAPDSGYKYLGSGLFG